MTIDWTLFFSILAWTVVVSGCVLATLRGVVWWAMNRFRANLEPGDKILVRVSETDAVEARFKQHLPRVGYTVVYVDIPDMGSCLEVKTAATMVPTNLIYPIQMAKESKSEDVQ